MITEIVEEMAAARGAARRQGLRCLLKQSVSLPHLHVLSVLQSEGPMRVSELAQSLDISVPSATGIVSRMVERGLVQRTRSEEDLRVVTVELASGGRAALSQIEERGREQVERVLGRVTLGELEQLQRGLRAFHRAQQEVTAGGTDEAGSGGKAIE